MEKKNSKKIIKIISISIVVIILLIISIFIVIKNILPRKYISNINSNYDTKQYKKVAEYNSKLELIKEYLGDNYDEYKLIKYKVQYSNAMALFEQGEYDKSLTNLQKIEPLDENIQNLINNCKYELVKKYINETKYNDALELLKDVINKEDILDLEDKIHYNLAFEYLNEKDYKNALEEISKVQNKDYENLNNAMKQIHYEYGKCFLEQRDYTSAIIQLEQAKEFEDANTLINNSYIEQAENYLKDGNAKEAKEIYNQLSDEFEYNGIKVLDRKNQLNKFAQLIESTGKKYATKSYCESRNVWKYDGRWENWYLDTPNSREYIDTSLMLNDDGTVTLSGTVYFYAFDNFSSLQRYCNAKIVSRDIKIYNITSIPSTYDLDSNTKLLYSNGTFSIKYSKKDDYSTNFYNLYTSSVTY